MKKIPYWIKLLLISAILSILGNIVYWVIASFNYGLCYSDIRDYPCSSGNLFFQGIIAALLIIEPIWGLSYIIPFVVLFLVGYYIIPLHNMKKR